MAYLGHKPAVGENNSFRILDDISSFVLTFDGSSASAVGLSDETITITENNHRFITGQRVTYSNGGGGNITGLTNGQAYFVINHSSTQIKLASSASNALAGTAVNLTGLGTGSSHTLTLAFDGVNTKFVPTFGDGMHDTLIKRAAQLVISINGVIQQPHDTATPSTGFGVDSLGNLIFSTAPASTDAFWAHVLATNTVTFDSSDNDVDTFTGNGSTTSFTLSKIPPDNRNILVTIDGVVQYPSDAANIRSYNLSENVMTFVAAPGNGTSIQVRHIGYAGPAAGGGGGVTGFYGRTGNVSLIATDNILANDATFSGNVSIAQTLTYEDVTDIDSVGLITARSGIKDQTLTAGRVVYVDSDKTLTDSASLTFDGNDVGIARSIFHSGDTNTHIGFPGNDSISFQTGGNRSFSIDSNANLVKAASGGTGNASVYARDLFISGSGNRGITIHTTSTSGSRLSCLFFGTGTSVADMADGMLFYDHGGQYMHFSTAGAGTGVTKSSIRLASDGTVRFDSTPTATNSISLLLKSHKARAVNDNNGILFRDAGDHSQAAMYVQKKSTSNATSDLVFRVSSGQVVNTLEGIPEKMRLTSDGVLRINNTRTTSTKLHVVGGTGSGTAYDAAVFAGGQNSTSGSGVKLYLSGCENDPLSRGVVLESIMTDNANAHRFSVKVSGSSAAPIERFRIASDGTVDFYGNQTNAPNGIFGFRYDRSNDTDLSIENLDNGSVNNNAGIRLASNHGNIKLRYFNNGGFYIQNSSTGYLHYYVNGTSTLYIDSSGNISINNAATPPSSNGGIGKRLGIKSTLNNIIVGETTNSGNFGLILESRVTGRSGDARSSQIGLGNGVIDFYTAASGAGVTKRLEITSTGALQHTGTSGVSYFTGSSEYIFGSTNSSPPAGGYESKVQIQDYKTRSALTVAAYMNNAGGPFMTFLSSRSGTVGTLGTKCINNDNLGGIRFSGDNATNYNSVAFGAEIFGKAKSTPADGDTIIAGEIHFATGNENGGAVQDKMIITSLGKIQYGLHDSGLPHAVQARGFVIYPNNGSNNITTIRVSGLVSGCFIFQMGYYNSSGQGEGGFACAVSGYMTSTNQYTIDNIKAPYAHANSSISSINKQNSYFEFSITNSHSSYTGGGTIGIIGDQEMTITVTYSS